MDQNIFWDRKISQSEAVKILSDATNGRFVDTAALLLSRTNDIKLVFSKYLDKALFFREWRRIKNEMRKNSWSDERIDLWGEVYKTLSNRIEFKDKIIKQKRFHKPAEFESIGQILKTERLRQKITQQALAGKADISQQTISNAENGKGDLSLKTLKKIMDVLNMEINIRQKGSTTSSFSFTLKE